MSKQNLTRYDDSALSRIVCNSNIYWVMVGDQLKLKSVLQKRFKFTENQFAVMIGDVTDQLSI